MRIQHGSASQAFLSKGTSSIHKMHVTHQLTASFSLVNAIVQLHTPY